MQSILKSFVVLACAVVLSLSVSRAASAQSIGTADMTGQVTDQQGAVLPGVTLVLRSTDSGLYRQGVSGPNGVYQFTGMLPGMYQIEVELSGFRKFERSNLKLEVGKTLGLDVKMELVLVERGDHGLGGRVPIVDLTSKTVGGFVETRELVDLPTANRSFTSYLAVLPGVVGGNIGGQGGTLYSFDGGNLNDATRGGDQVRIPIEAIQEFQLIVSQPDAQFGANGGVINAVSKTGTNEIHGTALSLIRDSALQERSYFEKLRGSPKPDAVRNQFAFSLGGPIVLNKMHYFGTYEHHVTRQARTPNIIGRPDINVTKIFPSTTYNVFARVVTRPRQPHVERPLPVRYLPASTGRRDCRRAHGGRPRPAVGRHPELGVRPEGELASLRGDALGLPGLVGGVQGGGYRQERLLRRSLTTTSPITEREGRRCW